MSLLILSYCPFFILIQWDDMETVLLHVLNWYELPNVIVMKQIFIYLGPTRHLYKLLSIDALRGSFGQPWLFIWEQRLCNVFHQFLDTNLTTVVPGQPWPAIKNLMTSDIISFSYTVWSPLMQVWIYRWHRHWNYTCLGWIP